MTVILLAETVGGIVAAPTTTLTGSDVQPEVFVAVKVYVVFGASPVIVCDALVTLLVPPGLLVKVPPTGKPLNTTEPVGTEQFGWVIVPTVGAAGKAGAGLIVTLFETPDIQPTLLVTVKV